jgi:oxalate decarboxylase
MRRSEDRKSVAPQVSRRNFLEAGTTALASAAIATLSVSAQGQTSKAHEGFHPSGDPGQRNKPLEDENPSSDTPPVTDHGDLGPIWYSFNLAHKRVENGGWTRQVTVRELPLSNDLAGVNMRLNSGSFRELHWHTAAEWAYVLYGTARISVLNPDGTVFIDDIAEGGLWYFPAGYPHSIQGLAPDGCEFLLVFDEGAFSEESTFLLSEWVAHTPHEVLKKNFRLDDPAVNKLPNRELFIFPADLPSPLKEDRLSVGGTKAVSPTTYSFDMKGMRPTKATSGGDVRIVDSHNFAPSRTIAAALVTLKPGALRELHWHPNGSEWQFYIAGKGRMTVFGPPGRARTMDFNANDVGFVPALAGHYIENTGNTDLVFLEMIKTDTFLDFSLNNWLRHVPPEMVVAHLNLASNEIATIPAEKLVVLDKEGTS